MNFLELLRDGADARGDRRLYTYLKDGGPDCEHLTYAELDERARAIATVLQESAPRGSRYLMLYPPGLEFVSAFFGCLYAGGVPVPAYPPDPMRLDRTLPRLRAIALDAGAKVVLAPGSIVAARAALVEHSAGLGELDWIATDEIPAAAAHAWRAFDPDPGTEALLQYTSGSTGTPRGVVVTHANLMDNSSRIREYFGHTRESNGVSWLPCYHDMGLVGGVLQPVYVGFPVTLMSPIDFLRHPIRWLDAISAVDNVSSGGPNFAFDLCIRRTTPEQREGLDLSGWSVAFTGAEPVRSATIDRFADAFAGSGFRREAFLPCYGLAESTLIVTGEKRGRGASALALKQADLQRGRAVRAESGDSGTECVVSCGVPLARGSVEIVSPQTRQPCEAGRVGEIWVSCESVAAGYWNRPVETQHTFGARLREDDGRRFLRTGDLGFFWGDQLFVRGRIKDLIVKNGRNLAPQDIERDVEEAHPALRRGCVAAFSIDSGSAEQIVVVCEANPEPGFEAAEVFDAVRAIVSARHGVPVHTVVMIEPRTIPKTSSGKIRRGACRDAFLSGELSLVGESAGAPASLAA